MPQKRGQKKRVIEEANARKTKAPGGMHGTKKERGLHPEGKRDVSGRKGNFRTF